MYVTVFFGTMTIGGVLWGAMAASTGLPVTHFIAAGGALLAIPLTHTGNRRPGQELDLSPSMHRPEPSLRTRWKTMRVP